MFTCEAGDGEIRSIEFAFALFFTRASPAVVGIICGFLGLACLGDGDLIWVKATRILINSYSMRKRRSSSALTSGGDGIAVDIPCEAIGAAGAANTGLDQADKNPIQTDRHIKRIDMPVLTSRSVPNQKHGQTLRVPGENGRPGLQTVSKAVVNATTLFVSLKRRQSFLKTTDERCVIIPFKFRFFLSLDEHFEGGGVYCAAGG